MYCTLYALVIQCLFVLRPNPKSLWEIKSTLAYCKVKVDSGMDAHGKCRGVDFGVDISWGYIVKSGTGSHTPCFSLDLSSVLRWYIIHSLKFSVLGLPFRQQQMGSPMGKKRMDSTIPTVKNKRFFFTRTLLTFSINNQGSWGGWIRNRAFFRNVFDQT
jgi:hypothetical protein